MQSESESQSAMQERVAFVTGGAQGIGRAIVRALLRRGVRVAFADADEEAGLECEEELRRQSGEARFFHCDVAREEDVASACKQTMDSFGRIDYVVNNAGRMLRKPVTELSYVEWQSVLATNLGSAFLTARHAGKELAKNQGAIVNIASTRASMSEPNTEAYSASKGGLLALTHSLAVSLGPDVRVNAVSPGWIETGELQKRSARRAPELSPEDHAQHPAGRVGRPEDVAELVVYLLSDAAGFVTGQEFIADGGMTRKMIYV